MNKAWDQPQGCDIISNVAFGAGRSSWQAAKSRNLIPTPGPVLPHHLSYLYAHS